MSCLKCLRSLSLVSPVSFFTGYRISVWGARRKVKTLACWWLMGIETLDSPSSEDFLSYWVFSIYWTFSSDSDTSFVGFSWDWDWLSLGPYKIFHFFVWLGIFWSVRSVLYMLYFLYIQLLSLLLLEILDFTQGWWNYRFSIIPCFS